MRIQQNNNSQESSQGTNMEHTVAGAHFLPLLLSLPLSYGILVQEFYSICAGIITLGLNGSVNTL